MPFLNTLGKRLSVEDQYTAVRDVLSRVTDRQTYNSTFNGASRGMRLSPDGSKMYLLALTGSVTATTQIAEFALSKAWDTTTATLTPGAFCNVVAIGSGSTCEDFFISPDGKYLYLIDFPGNNTRVLQCNMSTPFAVNTAVLVNTAAITTSFPAITTLASICFKTDGTRMYLTSLGTDLIYQFSLSQAWNVATFSILAGNTSVQGESNIRGIAFSGNGSVLYYVGSTNNILRKYNLSTPWDISTSSLSTSNLSLGAIASASIDVNHYGTRFYIASNAGTSGSRPHYQYIIR